MVRPKRIYKSKKGKYYYLRKGKKVYVKTPKTKKGKSMSQKQIVNVMVKNIFGDSLRRRVRPRTKRRRLKYTKKITEEQKEVQRQGLPVYLFEPQKMIPSLSERVSTKKVKKETDDYKDVLKQLSDIKQKLTEKKTKGIQTVVSSPPIIPKTTPIVRVRPEPVVETKEEEKVEDIEPSIPKDEDMDEEEEEEDMDEEEEEVDEVEDVEESKKRGEYFTFKTIDPFLKEIFYQIYEEETERTEKKNGAFKAYTEMLSVKKGEKRISGKSSESKKNIEKDLFEEFDVVMNIKYNNKTQTNFGGLLDTMILNRDKIPDEFKSKMKKIFKKYINFDKYKKTTVGKGYTEGDGLYNNEIEKITDKVIGETTIPVIAKNQLNELDQYIKPNMKRFGFIINTDSVPQKNEEGGHWRCVFINNSDDYQTIEYFDPLVSTPEKTLIQKLRNVSKKINPEQYFLFKNNNLQSQPNGSPNCGFHCILFLEKRFHGIPWSEATYYDEYMKQNKPHFDGEVEIKKKIKKYSSYI